MLSENTENRNDHLIAFPLDFTPGAIIFDCDGTLADTMPLHYSAWRETLDLHAPVSDLFPEAQFYAWGGVPAREIMERLNNEHGLSMPAVEIAELKEANYRRQVPRVQPIEAIIAEAKRFQGLCPLAVASGGARVVVEETLRTLGIRGLFSVVVGSEDVQRGKPAPDIFLLAAERLGVAAANCVVFEDAPAGLLAARRAGMRAVNVLAHLPAAQKEK